MNAYLVLVGEFDLCWFGEVEAESDREAIGIVMDHLTEQGMLHTRSEAYVRRVDRPRGFWTRIRVKWDRRGERWIVRGGLKKVKRTQFD